MASPSLPATEYQRRQRNAAKVIAFFREHRGEWIDIPTLEKLGGRNAWRTRVSDARAIFCRELGWAFPVKDGPDPIENRQTRTVVTDADGRKHVAGPIISEYRYWPFVIVGESETPSPDRWPVLGSPMATAEPFSLTPPSETR